MAKTVNGDLVVFDAAGQGEGFACWLDTQRSVYEPESATPAMGTETVVYQCPLYVRFFRVVTGGTGGDVRLYTRKVASTADPTEENKPDEQKRFEVLFLDETPADDTLWVPYGGYVPGLYVDTLPSGARIFVHLGEE